MAQIISLISAAVSDVFRNEISSTVHAISQREDEDPELPELTILDQNISPEVLEKKAGASYPSLHLYCERLENRLTERFRLFSGIAHMVAEIRLSLDYSAPLDRFARFYGEAVTTVLDHHRGDWRNGIFYGGGYEMSFSSIKHGGKNYLQTVKISFVLNASLDQE